MKRKTGLVLIICVLILCIVGVSLLTSRGKKPYKNLSASQILSATVRLTPPDKTIQIAEIKELAAYLEDVVIYKKDNSYTEYAGQGVTFTLTMSNGTQTQIMAYNPFLVIDGIGYKTKYEPCEALNNYANRLLNDENANIILEEPPTLAVISDNTSMGALLGSYSWQKINADGTITAFNAESAHPLDCEDLLLKFETTEQAAALNFTERPDRISAQCWSDECWGTSGADSEKVDIDGNQIMLKPNGYIYEIKAEWDTDNGYGGIASYSFYADYSK
ncbi:hypothetical protein [Parablautia muri]|uniref:hypothetical protein n=1 Tax=Parablautia muri TaxID=2320879 RepID=UPI0024126EA2|nr:hypothetical protein [Parablautia muri]